MVDGARKQGKREKREKADRSARCTSERFACNVLVGRALLQFADGVQDLKARDCFDALERYLYGPSGDRVLLLFGLQGTGKTTLLRQAIARMSPEDLRRCACIKTAPSDGMDQLNRAVKTLNSLDYRYVFLDAVTLAEDFIDSAALFSDVYAAQGMKLVLSGKDSLGFWFALHEELYDRAYTIQTTYIPYREYSRLLGRRGIDGYLRCGGTLWTGEKNGEDQAIVQSEISFGDGESPRRYIETAISRNIQHSLACYQRGNHFRHLRDLYYANRLADAITLVVEDMSGAYLLDVLTRRKSMRAWDPTLQFDRETVTACLEAILETRHQELRDMGAAEAQVREIREYLQALDLFADCPMETRGLGTEPQTNVLFTQPGLRYCQAQALVQELMRDKAFAAVPERERNVVCDWILEAVRECLLEDIVLLGTGKAAKAHQKVFRLQFSQGAYDMVVYDRTRACCAIYEITRSDKVSPEYFADAEMLRKTEYQYGPAVRRWVLYRGPTLPAPVDGLSYCNVEEYLEALPEIAFDEMPGNSSPT